MNIWGGQNYYQQTDRQTDKQTNTENKERTLSSPVPMDRRVGGV